MAAGVPVVAAVRPDNFPGVRAGQRAGPRAGPGGRRRRARRRARRPAGLTRVCRARIGAAGQRLVRRAVLDRRRCCASTSRCWPGWPAAEPGPSAPGVRRVVTPGGASRTASTTRWPGRMPARSASASAVAAGQRDEAVQLGGQRLAAGHQLRDLDDRLLPCTTCPCPGLVDDVLVERHRVAQQVDLDQPVELADDAASAPCAGSSGSPRGWRPRPCRRSAAPPRRPRRPGRSRGAGSRGSPGPAPARRPSSARRGRRRGSAGRRRRRCGCARRTASAVG